MERSARKTTNTVVSKHYKPLIDELKAFALLFVRLGQINTTGKKTTSRVWAYFGALCRWINVEASQTHAERGATTFSASASLSTGSVSVNVDISQSTSSSSTLNLKVALVKNYVIVDDKMYCCILYLKQVQDAKLGNINDIQSYSLQSSADSLRNHLISSCHNVPRQNIDKKVSANNDQSKTQTA